MENSVQPSSTQEQVSAATAPSVKKHYPPTVVILMLAFLFLTVGFLGGYFIASQKTSNELKRSASQITPTIEPIGSICPTYGVLDPSQFLTSYTTQKDDTIFSIADKTFHDITMASEITDLNRQFDPQFEASPGAQFTPSTKVYLPPKEMPKITGALSGIGGMYVRTQDHYYWLRTRTENSENGDTPIILTANTKFVGNIKPGDCVIVISESNTTSQKSQNILIKKVSKAQ